MVALRTSRLFETNPAYRRYAERLIQLSEDKIDGIRKEEALTLELEDRSRDRREALERLKETNERLVTGDTATEVDAGQLQALNNRILLELAAIQVETSIIEQRRRAAEQEMNNLMAEIVQAEMEARVDDDRNRVYAIRGLAGAGKTTCLSEIRKGLEAAGRTALYLAPTSSAVEVLRKDGFTDANTVDSFLANNKNDLTDSVVIIDESSLQSNEMGAAVLRAARNARVLFVGDTRQHVSVEAGDFLRVLEQHSKLRYSELKDIRRQVVQEYNAAVRTLCRATDAQKHYAPVVIRVNHDLKILRGAALNWTSSHCLKLTLENLRCILET